MTMIKQVNAVKAALVNGNYIQSADTAEERARNIVQALSGLEASEPGDLQAAVADILWTRKEEVRFLYEAAKAVVRAWTLSQEPDVASRMSLLADVGVPYNTAQKFLETLGLWSL